MVIHYAVQLDVRPILFLLLHFLVKLEMDQEVLNYLSSYLKVRSILMLLLISFRSRRNKRC